MKIVCIIGRRKKENTDFSFHESGLPEILKCTGILSGNFGKATNDIIQLKVNNRIFAPISHFTILILLIFFSFLIKFHFLRITPLLFICQFSKNICARRA